MSSYRQRRIKALVASRQWARLRDGSALTRPSWWN